MQDAERAEERKLRQQHPIFLATDTLRQSWKNIVFQSSQASADCWTNSLWHLILMQKNKNAHAQYSNVKTTLSQTNTHKVQRAGEQAHHSLSHQGPCRNTEVRWLQTFPSPLHPRGVLRYFHFTNNLRTVAQDLGSGGATDRARFQNREADISLSLARDQRFTSLWVTPDQRRGEKLPASVEIVMSCWVVADQFLWWWIYFQLPVMQCLDDLTKW